MVDPKRVETFYDWLDESCMALYEELHTPYLDGISESANNLLSQSIEQDVLPETKQKLNRRLTMIRTIEFQKEEIRKALQLAILKGFKHVRRSNEDMTPDTIGLFATFLLEKLLPGNQPITLLDPLVGTGNLLLTIANNLKRDVIPIGVDRDPIGFHLAEAMFDLMQYPDHLYFQDTFTFHDAQAEAIVTDFPFSRPEKGTYFPYEVIRFHHANLRPGGYFLGVVSNDFFEVEGHQVFHEIVQSLYQIVGLVKLPDSMFKAMGKSLLILQKRDEWIQPLSKVLLAEIPSFQDPNAVNEAIRRIDAWFMENIKHKEEDN